MLVVLLMAGAVGPALAFPPAPHHTLYGMVRTELGEPLMAEDAIVVLETAAGVQLRTAVVPGLGPGENYRLHVPMDAGLTADNYRPTALRPQVPFRMKVLIGDTVWLPIETRADYAHLGEPARETRLDLTLGEDSDGDGLPDAWERMLIGALGGGVGLGDIRPDDDADRDGLTNLQEYLAGTYAFDPQDGFRIDLIERDDGEPEVAFTALRGRTYMVEGSTDLEHWERLAFRLSGAEPDEPVRTYYHAASVCPVKVRLVGESGSFRFYRLLVR